MVYHWLYSYHILFNIVGEQSFLPPILASFFAFSYCLFSIPIVVIPTFIVQQHQITTAYGLNNAATGIIFTCTSVIAGTIIDYSGYLWLEIFYVLLLGFALLLLIAIIAMELFANGEDKRVNKTGWWLNELICHKLTKGKKKQQKMTKDDLKDIRNVVQ